jgi:peptidyl-dipeptidase A
MPPTAEQFIDDITPTWRRLAIESGHAEWQVATTGTPEASERFKLTQIALKNYFADRERYETARALAAAGHPDPDVARALQLIYLECARNRVDPESIKALANLEAQMRDLYTNFRAEYRGRAVTDNELDSLLADSRSSDEVREAWEASKAIGPQVAGQVREVARMRNEAARKLGFRDHFAKALKLDEVDEDELLSIFGRLETATDEPFAMVKAEIDASRAEWFGVSIESLYPWHYGDRFFQSAPRPGDVDLDSYFADSDPVTLALATYDGLGLDTRDILVRSDLYEREGKDQHAFCIDIDREGDVRTLNNLKPNRRWTDTLLHELGHAVYDKFKDRAQPWILRTIPHLLSTEAIAMMMGSLTYDAQWLAEVLKVPAAQAADLSAQMQKQDRFTRLIFTRWVLVMTHFERALYADPEGDLDTLWWDLVERFQRLRRPPNRAMPDWAAKIHIALYPVYYHNYELGYLTSAQILKALQGAAGGLTGRPAAGQWLVEHWFRPGAKYDWSEHIRQATGEKLNPDYFVTALV